MPHHANGRRGSSGGDGRFPIMWTFVVQVGKHLSGTHEGKLLQIFFIKSTKSFIAPSSHSFFPAWSVVGSPFRRYDVNTYQ
jgi:hypothetical protein